MNYSGIYEFLSYAKSQGIKIEKELLNYLLTLPSIKEEQYFLLEKGRKVIEAYFSLEEWKKNQVLCFIEHMESSLSETKLLEGINLIASQDDATKMAEIRWACETVAIRENKAALHLIADQNDRDKMRQLRIDCEEGLTEVGKVPLIGQELDKTLESGNMDEFLQQYENLDNHQKVKQRPYILKCLK